MLYSSMLRSCKIEFYDCLGRSVPICFATSGTEEILCILSCSMIVYFEASTHPLINTKCKKHHYLFSNCSFY